MKGIFTLSIVFIGNFLFAQEKLQQRVTGMVLSETQRVALVGASVVLKNSKDSVVTLTDPSGNFQFDDVSPGRYVVRASFTGYRSAQQEILVVSSRVTAVKLFLEEWPGILEEVEITASSASLENGEQSITIEKTMRVPANFFDPVRVITSYPGVMTSNDQNNTIIIRGNSPAGLLWKINGLDVVNPNHLANAGTFSDKPAAYGGGVNIISAQLLDRTDFYPGSVPSRYGNSLSGIVDMQLREGDKTDYHYTVQASLIGLDAAAEGPLGKNGNTSFLANYRYSTVGLLSALGAKFGDEDISFQDLSFAIDSKLSGGRQLSFFGFFGSSKNDFEHKDSLEWEIDKDRYDIQYTSKNYGAGVTLNQVFRKINIASGIAVSGSEQDRVQSPSPQIEAGEMNVVYEDRFSASRLLVSAFSRISAKINSSQLESGITVNYSHDDLLLHVQNGISPVEETSGTVNGFLVQPYAQWRIFLSDKWIAQTGMRYLLYSYNNKGILEPRIALEYFPASKSSFKLSYNLVSQVQQAGTYVNDNKNLELNKSHHLDLGYVFNNENGFRFSSTVYYQKLFDIPVEKTSSSYSLINSIETVALPDLVSEGSGSNYGIELLTEKSFLGKSYFIAGGSWYKSEYKGSDDVTRSTRFDGNYSVNITYGKEWSKVKKESHRTFGASTRLLYLGGLSESPITPDPNSPATVYDETNAFQNKLPDYFRLDLRLAWRKNKPNYTRTLALDIQNLFNIQNTACHYYDHVKQKTATQYQLGLIPVLVYRVEF